MTNEQREVFWKVLENLDGKDMMDDSRKLTEAIEFPQYLYRYRPINEYSLDNLRTNTLFFSSADKFDDPFDAYIHVNSTEVKEEVDTFFNDTENLSLAKAQLELLYGNNAPQLDELAQKFIMELFSTILKNTRFCIQRSIRAACFSEDATNRALWLKYGANHSGFCLIYDYYNDENFICGTKEDCKQCKNATPLPLYPVYYSKEKLNAAQYVKQVAALLSLQRLSAINKPYFEEIQEEVNKKYGNGGWWTTKISTIKEYAHNQDKEWRLVIYDPTSEVFIKKWKPCGIIFGLRTTNEHKGILTALAKEAGIQNFYQAKINENDELINERIENP